MQTADATVWMQLIGLGCLLGALGQGVRAIVGLKKMSDGASDSGKSAASTIDGGRLLTSLLIGAIAGALAAIGLVGVAGNSEHVIVSASQISALLGAGYAGADFIEGFMNRAKGDPGVPAGTEVVGTGSGDATPAPAPAPTSSDQAVG